MMNYEVYVFGVWLGTITVDTDPRFVYAKAVRSFGAHLAGLFDIRKSKVNRVLGGKK